MSNMFPEENMKDFNTSSDHGLRNNIKCEFAEEEMKIEFGVMENQLLKDEVTDMFSLHDDEDGENPGSFQKNQPTISDKVSQEDVKIEPGDCKSDITEESDISLDYKLSNIKSEFDEEETKIQYGIAEVQLYEENITTLQNFNGASSDKNETTVEKPRKCEICSKCFCQNGDLKRHMRIHTGEKPHKCEICGKCFTIKQSLKIHIRIHTGEKPHKCEICSKCFCQNGDLKKHMMIHTGEKPHKCEICSKCFSQNVGLKTHMITHTEEKSHKCEICGKCFRASRHLKRHMMIHTGEKPRKCEICSKCFSENRDLKRHMMIHTGEKPHKCETCGKYFNQKVNLNQHIMKIHKGN